MANHYPAQVVKFSAYIWNGTAVVPLPTVSARFTHTINQLPMVEITAQLDNEKIKNLNLNLDDFTSLAKETQSYLINNLRLNADIQVLAQDGQGALLTFNGFISNPFFTFQSGLLMLRYTGVHLMSGLQGFNMNIYDIPAYYGNVAPNQAVNNTSTSSSTQADVTALLSTAAINNPSSIAARLDTLISIILDLFSKRITEDDSGQGINDLVTIHNINKVIYAKFIKPFLTRSNLSTVLPGLLPTTDIASIPSLYIATALDNELARLLFSAEHFAGTIPGLCNDFRFQFNADWTGNAWLEPLQMYSDPGMKALKAPTENISYSVANTFELPLIKVYMYMPVGDWWGYHSITPSLSPSWSVFKADEAAALALEVTHGNSEALQSVLSNMPNLLQYPTTSLTSSDLGVFYIVTPPNWLAPEVGVLDDSKDVLDKSELSLKESLSGIQAIQTRTNVFDLVKRTILQPILEDTFNERFLGSSAAYLTLPFCAPVQVGYTYNVQSITDSSSIFIGYLNSVTHTVTQEEGRGSIQTNCVFSHIKIAGVKFEGIDKTTVTPSV